MRTFTASMLIALAGCTSGVSLTDATEPPPTRPVGAPGSGSGDGGIGGRPGQNVPSDHPDAGPTSPAPAPADAGPPPPPPMAPIFPADSPWNTRIDDEPVDPQS